MTSKHSGWRGRSSADHTSASTTVHDCGRPSRAKPDERRSVQTFEAQAPGDEVFPATHESGNTRGTAEFTTTPRVKQPSSGDNALYTHSRVKGRGPSGSG